MRVPRKRRLGRPRRFSDQLSQKSLASRTFIVQNGPAWSWVTRRPTALNRAKIGRYSPVLGTCARVSQYFHPGGCLHLRPEKTPPSKIATSLATEHFDPEPDGQIKPPDVCEIWAEFPSIAIFEDREIERYREGPGI